MKKILLLATGGTIASKSSEDGLVPVLSSEELMSFIPSAKEFCSVHAKQLFNLDSTNVEPRHWLELTEAIKKNYEDYDGFVITHGTDTMAYTAAALSYLIQNSKKPIVLTGSQKPIDMEVTDAKTNLLDSLRFASSEHGAGVFIVFDGKAILGTRAKKVRSKTFAAFDSINYPTVAIITENKIVQYIKIDANDEPLRFYDKLDEKVFLLKLTPGLSPEMLSYIGEKYDGIIIESYGVGGIPSVSGYDFMGEIGKLVSGGKIIVMTTQVMLEGSNMSVYQVGVVAKNKFGLMEAYDMTLEATITKLMWVLAQTKEPKKVHELFMRPVHLDTLYSE